MKQTPATRRLSEQLREKLGYILLFEIADPRLDLVTITGVEVAQDRSYARIFVSCDGDRYEEVLDAARPAAKGAHPEPPWPARSTGASCPSSTSASTARRTRPCGSRAALENVPPTIGVEKDEEGLSRARPMRPASGAARCG